MLQYDLNIFSPNEFEEFSRDLLQAKMKGSILNFRLKKEMLSFSQNDIKILVRC